jgi:hypothetical protein
MVRIRPMTAARAAGLTALLAAGCATQTQLTESVSRAVKSVETSVGAIAAPEPATQMMCIWQRKLSSLPDPTKEGAPLSPGIAGQMFLFTAAENNAEVNGDVTVAVYDETKRTDGKPPHTPEVWHFTADVLKKMGTNDERFGKSYVLYLPWRQEWSDVTTVRILSRYDAPGATTLHAGEVRLALDLESEGPVWADKDGTAAKPAGFNTRTVPNGAQVVQQAKASATAGSGSGVKPAAATAPPTTQAAQNPIAKWFGGTASAASPQTTSQQTAPPKPAKTEDYPTW